MVKAHSHLELECADDQKKLFLPSVFAVSMRRLQMARILDKKR